MAALRWVVHSACHVLGYPKDTNTPSDHQMVANAVGYPTKEHANGDVVKNSLKVPTNAVGQSYTAEMCPSGFQMPLHYPRYSKADYEKMEEWKLDNLLKQYGLNFKGTFDEKREYAKGAFLWPEQY
ncbi:hypothetical protein PanWU01x14_314870 [Parasponia andersonii]|uniref:DUF7722 domain-containing protein n=1 Tax=Parasponia andersonii TaxID=3476 RepID=A0A2P5ANL1_PARAD|nr:hypothetical protein PanWU01x14_314870 [Parasponia andersonii]